MSSTAPRRYRSPRRAQQAQQTRQAVLGAARALFVERGWAGTGMRDVAAAAGVSVETIYAGIGSKPAVLAAALDGAVVGDDDPVPLHERPAFRAMGEGATLAERARAAADLITDIHVRVAALERALREGAAAEPALAALLVERDRNRRVDDVRGITMVLRRDPSDAEADAFWAQTSSEVWELLVTRAGWTSEQYRDWVADLVVAMDRGTRKGST